MSSRILIVDDDAMIQGFLRLALENDGYVVSEARSAAEMRTLFQQGGIDLIILDLGLPDGDGLDLVAEIRTASSLPIIVASARQGASDRVAALERGADDYMTKPFDPKEMLLRLKNLLSRCQPAPGFPPLGEGAPMSSAEVKPPVPPTMKTSPVNPVPQSIHPVESYPAPQSVHPVESNPAPQPMSAEASLQAAAKKSAPSPVSKGPAKGNVDKSVVFAGLIAVIAFGGAGFYWFTNSMTSSTDSRIAALERQLTSQNSADNLASDGQPRRGALQPPSEPDVKIAQPSAEAAVFDREPLTRSVIAPSTPTRQAEPNPPQARPVPAAPAPLPASSTAWVKNSKCEPLPDLNWWRVKTHQQVVRYVNREHEGDWRPYLNNWRARIEKLQDISDRGSGIKTSSGEILQGETLENYIRDTSDRISIIQCLSREARLATRR